MRYFRPKLRSRRGSVRNSQDRENRTRSDHGTRPCTLRPGITRPGRMADALDDRSRDHGQAQAFGLRDSGRSQEPRRVVASGRGEAAPRCSRRRSSVAKHAASCSGESPNGLTDGEIVVLCNC